LFSPNEDISDIDPQHLKYLLLPYYQAETMFRLMDERKKRIQVAKNFYDEFLKLMDYYELVDDISKTAWKASISPEDYRDAAKVSDNDDREAKIKEFRRKKLIEQQIDKLKDSEDVSDVKEFWMNMIYISIIKSISGLKSIDMEFMILVYRDSLPLDKRGPSEPPKEKKPMEMFHIPKEAVPGTPYMLGNPEEQQPTGQSSVVKTFNETGNRVSVDTGISDANARSQIKDQMKAQVFQPCWNQPTMSLDEFGEMEYQDMMARDAQDKQREAEEEAKDEETLEEEARQKAIANDYMKDEIPKGYGNTKRL
jgi:hypothetical protein